MQLLKPNADEKLIKALIDGIYDKNNVHAYLFEGEKEFFTCEAAMYFATALVCESEEEIPCGKCTNCIWAAGGNNPDIKRISLTEMSGKKSVGADDIRDIISDVYTKPFSAKNKVYIIEDGDSLTPQAQNAMLKVLEEPPSYAVFIVCITNLQSILPTVISRSRVLRFRPKDKSQICEYVRQKYPHMSDRADFVAAFSEGVIGRADMLCQNEDVLSLRDNVLDLLDRLLRAGSERAVFEMCAMFEQFKASKNDENIQLALDFILSFLCDILKICAGAQAAIVNSDKSRQLSALAAISGYEKADFCAECVMQTKQMLLRYVNTKAAVMRLALSLYYGKSGEGSAYKNA